MTRINKKIIMLIAIALALLSLTACGFVSYVEYKSEESLDDLLHKYISDIGALSNENYYRDEEKRIYVLALIEAKNELSECKSADELDEVFERHKEIILAIPTNLDYVQEYCIELMYSYANENKYRDAERAEVDALTSEYLTKIRGTDNTLSAELTLYKFQEALAKIKTHLQLLADELEEYSVSFGYDIDYSKYNTAEQEKITAICSEFRERILAIKDIDEADKYVDETQATLNAIPTKESILSTMRTELKTQWEKDFESLSTKYGVDSNDCSDALAKIANADSSADANLIGARAAIALLSEAEGELDDFLEYASLYINNVVNLQKYRTEEQGYVKSQMANAIADVKEAKSASEIQGIINSLSSDALSQPTNDELWEREQEEFLLKMKSAYTYALNAPKSLTHATSYTELAKIIDYYAFYQTSDTSFVRSTFRVAIDFPHNNARYTVNEVYWYCELIRSAVGIDACFEEDSSQLVITLIPYALASKSNASTTTFYKRHDSVISFKSSSKLTARAKDFEAFPYLELYKGKYVEVWTSQQLWYALEHEYIPVPVKNSPAEIVLERAKQILREIIKEGMTQEEKIFAIYSWYADNVSYDFQYINCADCANKDSYPDSLVATLNSFHAEGALLEGLAVCCSYAKSALILMRIEGIEAYRVILHDYSDNEIGNHGQSGYGSHAIIALKGTDGKYYYCDVEQSSYSDKITLEKYHQLLVSPKEQWPLNRAVDCIYSDLDYAEALPIESFWSKLEYKGTSVLIKTEAQLRELISKFRSENNTALQLTVFDTGEADFDVKAVLDGYTDISLHQCSFGGLTEYTIYIPMESYNK